MQVDEIPEFQIDVVAIGAHPDDTDIFCGGTLAKLSKQGISTGIIDLTNAEPTPSNDLYISPSNFDPDYDAVRKAEAQCASRQLGLTVRLVMDLPNRRLFDTFEARCQLATVFRKWKPKLVILPYGRSVMHSPDHHASNNIAEAALFYSRLTKWEEYMGNLPVHRIASPPIYYPIIHTDLLSDHPSIIPYHPVSERGQLTSFFIDISEEITSKEAAILCYKSQFKQDPKKFAKRILTRDADYGKLLGVKYAELLLSTVPVLVDNFAKLFLESNDT